MAIIIHKVQNDNTSQEKSFGKWYPRVVNLKTIDLDGLCEHIATPGCQSRHLGHLFIAKTRESRVSLRKPRKCDK